MCSDPFGSLMNAFSPIAIFASKPGRQENKLKPVAIQINSSSGELIYRVSSLSSGHALASPADILRRAVGTPDARLRMSAGEASHAPCSSSFVLWPVKYLILFVMERLIP